MADSNTNINSESPALAKAAADSAKMANRIFIFGLLAVIISPSLAGFVLGIIALVLFEKNKKIVTRFKKASAGKILGGIGLFLSVLLLLYELLIMPVKNPPAWLKAIRDAFYTSAFYADFENNFITDNRISYIFKGLVITFEVTFFAALLGIALGVIVALIRSSYDTTKEELRPGFGKTVLFCLNKICGIYLTVIRGTPVVVQLMITYFVIFASSNNKVLVAILAFGINSGAYVAEIIRGGIMSIDRGQFEAGRSLGFGYVKTMTYIIIPQAFKTVLPSLANEFIVLIKETSVSGYIGLQELTKGGDIIRSRTYSAFMPLIAVAIIYLIIVMFFSWIVSLLERRLKNSER